MTCSNSHFVASYNKSHESSGLCHNYANKGKTASLCWNYLNDPQISRVMPAVAWCWEHTYEVRFSQLYFFTLLCLKYDLIMSFWIRVWCACLATSLDIMFERSAKIMSFSIKNHEYFDTLHKLAEMWYGKTFADAVFDLRLQKAGLCSCVYWLLLSLSVRCSMRAFWYTTTLRCIILDCSSALC